MARYRKFETTRQGTKVVDRGMDGSCREGMFQEDRRLLLLRFLSLLDPEEVYGITDAKQEGSFLIVVYYREPLYEIPALTEGLSAVVWPKSPGYPPEREARIQEEMSRNGGDRVAAELATRSAADIEAAGKFTLNQGK